MKFQLIKFKSCDETALRYFVKFGFIIFENVFDSNAIDAARSFFFRNFRYLEEKYKEGKISKDVQGWSNAIIDAFSTSTTYNQLITSPNVIKILNPILGPDIAVLNFDHAWINTPSNTDPVLTKELHTDAWTGTSMNTVLANTYITDVDEFNGLSVVPASHTHGMTPVRNRRPDPSMTINYDLVNLTNLRAGDFILWHPLLLHSTTGNSDKNIRISISSRYTSTETPFSTQERALSYRTLSIGPMNQIARLVGNDYLTPYRTFGGTVGVERRLRHLYDLCDYTFSSESEPDYKKILDGIKGVDDA